MKNMVQFFTLALLCATSAVAQEEAKPDKIFSTDEVLKVTLEGPWRAITRENRKTDTWQGHLAYTDAGGVQVRLPVTISRRGLTRQRICDFPPLRLEFDKEAAKGTAFRGAGNLKMVTHCFVNARYSQYYIKEFLAYRMYNAVTPLSFRVQGLDVRYVDNAGDSREIERFAFLIEDPDDVAKRNGLQKLSIEETSPDRLDPLQTERFVMFQYLISNLDWEVLAGPDDTCCHNARLIGKQDNSVPIVPLPYDLDASGLVNTHYAAPPAILKVRSVRDRLYRGFCRHNALVPEVLKEFRDLRPQFEAVLQNEPRLDERNRKDALRFVNGFYDVLKDEQDVTRRLTGSCRG